MAETTNPVYERLTRGRDIRTARWIGRGVLALAAGLGAAPALLPAPPDPVLYGLGLVGASGVGLAALGGAFGWVAIRTARLALDGDLRLVRASPMTPQEIAGGLVEAALAQVREVRLAAQWSPPAAGLALLAAGLLGQLARGCPGYAGCGGVFAQAYGIGLLLMAWAAFQALRLGMIGRLAASGGVWTGLRWPHSAALAVAVILLIGAALAVLLGGLVAFTFVAIAPGTGLCVLVALDLVSLAVSHVLAEETARDAVTIARGGV